MAVKAYGLFNFQTAGYAGVVQYAGLRIAGFSGIYNKHYNSLGHFEHPPYSKATKRSVYLMRDLELFRLEQLSRRVDVVLSHDWPHGIYNYGNKADLPTRPNITNGVKSDSIGSPHAEQLLHRLRPRYWFAAHMHVKFAAVYPREEVSDQKSESGLTKYL